MSRPRVLLVKPALVFSAIVIAGLITTTPAHAADAAAGARTTYLAQLDKACALTNQRLANAAKDYERHITISQKGASSKKTRIGKPADVAEFIDKVAAREMTDLFVKLKSTSVPAEEQTAMTRLFADADKALASMKAAPEKVAFTDPFGPVVKQFRQLGFVECGRNVSTDKPLAAA